MPKLHIRGDCCVDSDKRNANAAYARTLGLPFIAEKERPPLAVLGGGHSIRERLEEIRAFKGDKWIIGSSFRWWYANGIDGTFFSVHPSRNALDNIRGVKRALLATVTDPSVISQLQDAGADIELFESTLAGSTTATAAPWLAVNAGYRDVTFYGCDSNYTDSTHFYMDAPDPYLMRVRCNGQEFLTGAEFVMQAEMLAAVIRACPNTFKERSGGLLAAMVADPEVDTTHISKTLAAGLAA